MKDEDSDSFDEVFDGSRSNDDDTTFKPRPRLPTPGVNKRPLSYLMRKDTFFMCNALSWLHFMLEKAVSYLYFTSLSKADHSI